MNSKFLHDKNNKKWLMKKNTLVRKNQTLMKKLYDMFCGFDQESFLKKQNFIESKKMMSNILRQWVNIEMFQHSADDNISKIKNKNQQVSTQIEQYLPISILQYDFSVKCQISGLIPTNPSRTSQCKFLCVVDRGILQQINICSCGRQVQKYQNQIVDDWVLGLVVKYYNQFVQENEKSNNSNKLDLNNVKKEIQNKKWKGLIRIYLQQNDFEFIYK